MPVYSINPATEETLEEIRYISKDELMLKIEQAHKAYTQWKKISFHEKSTYFKTLIDIFEREKETLARIDAIEMGMPIREALGDVSKSIANIAYFIQNAERMIAPESFEKDGIRGQIRYEPMGAVYMVAPWNFPINQVIRSTIPNIIAGNVMLVKHASNVPQMARKLEAMFLEAGFPPGVYTHISIPGSYSEDIISHPHVIGVTITGGDKAGRTIGGLAGKYLKPSVLELGGSDPLIILSYTDREKIVGQAILGRMANNGQKCNSSKRIIILDEYYDDFSQTFTEKISSLRLGNPLDRDTEVGPLARLDLLEEIHAHVESSIAAGARLLTGGKRIAGEGYYYKPTVLTGVKPGMSVFDEEIFGPVAPLIRARDIDHAIELANMSRYGLGCSILGGTTEEQSYIAERVACANVTLGGIVTSYPGLPYGGIKDSGYGKELGLDGIRTFLNQKVIVRK